VQWICRCGVGEYDLVCFVVLVVCLGEDVEVGEV